MRGGGGLEPLIPREVTPWFTAAKAYSVDSHQATCQPNPQTSMIFTPRVLHPTTEHTPPLPRICNRDLYGQERRTNLHKLSTIYPSQVSPSPADEAQMHGVVGYRGGDDGPEKTYLGEKVVNEKEYLSAMVLCFAQDLSREKESLCV